MSDNHILSLINYEEGKSVIRYLLDIYNRYDICGIKEDHLNVLFYHNNQKLRLFIKTRRGNNKLLVTCMLNYLITNTCMVLPTNIIHARDDNKIIIDSTKNNIIHNYLGNIYDVTNYKDIIHKDSLILEIFFNTTILKSRNIKLVGNSITIGMCVDKISRLYNYKNKYYLIERKYYPVINNLSELEITTREDARCLLNEYCDNLLKNVDISTLFKEYELEDMSILDEDIKFYHVL